MKIVLIIVTLSLFALFAALTAKDLAELITIFINNRRG